MRRRIAVSPTEGTILLLVVLALVQFATPVRGQITLTSGWMTQPVTLDGQITRVEEWSDAIPVDLTMSNRAGQSVSTRVWVKNDLKSLFILASVKWPASDIHRRDRFQFFILSGPHGPGTVYDGAEVCFEGTIWDSYGPTQPWVSNDDTRASPPGENNVRGAASHNGTHYWFEFGRALNTGDRYDIVIEPGKVYPIAFIGFVDDDKPTNELKFYQLYVMLRFAPVLPSIEFVKPEDQTATSVSQVRFIASVLGHLSKVTLAIEGKDYEMRLNQAGLHETSLTLADGIYKWRMNVLGVLGDVSSIPERTLTVDTTKPSLTVRSPNPGEVIRKSEVLVSWEALDATSGIAKVEVKIDASDWIDVTGKTSHTATWVVEGNHEVRVRATDRTGNVAEEVRAFTAMPPPWYTTYWYVPLAGGAAVVAIAATMVKHRRRPVKPPEAKPPKIAPPPRPPTRKDLLKELNDLYKSGKITETAYRRLKKKYET